MTIKERIQSWLGIDIIITHLCDIRNNRLNDLHVLKSAREEIAIHNCALGRIIAKLDSNYALSEFDLARIAESNKLANKVIAKLIAEHKASNP